MGIDVAIESENGEREAEVLDPKMYFARALRSPGIEHTLCLRFIDPYGDTVFNQLQIPLFIAELESLRNQVQALALSVPPARPLVADDKAGTELSIAPEAMSSEHSLMAAAITQHLDSVLRLARRANGAVHTYLKCYGD